MPTHHKHLLNDPATLVTDSLKGLCLLNPNIDLDEKQRVIYKRQVPQSQVSLISGGGSGHEPAHAGFVGDGLLSAAVCGNIFASPNVGQIRRAIDLVGNDKGTLVVVKNYTGDVLHFGLASEQYKASGAPGDVRLLIVGDDVTVGRTQGGLVGRRGLAGTVLVYKIAAALARTGASLDEVEAIGKLVADSLGTVGIGLEHCHVPGTEEGESHLGSEEVELGMGIHNEPGHSRINPFPSLSKLIDDMLPMVTSTSDKDRGFLPFKGDGSDDIVLMVNNLGAVSELELGGVTGEAVKWLHEHNINIKRVLVGTYMTSLNMPGFSLTLLLLPRSGSKTPYSSEKILSLLDAPTDAPGWKWHASSEPATPATVTSKPQESESAASRPEVPLSAPDAAAFLQRIGMAARALIAAEPEITRQDQIAGDGDAGLTLKAGAEGVLEAIESGHLKAENVITAVMVIAEIVDDKMGGTSGALYSIYLSALAKGLRDAAQRVSVSVTSLEIWSEATRSALTTLEKYTRARPPSRTLIDPLTAFVNTLPNGLNAAVDAARKAAEDTKHMVAKAGRAAYVDQEQLAHADVPDPGAWGVAVLVAGLAGRQHKA